MEERKRPATIEALLARKQQMEQAQKKVCDLGDGMTIELVKPPLDRMLRALDMAQEAETTMDSVRANCMLVYESAPILHSKELLQAYEPVEPHLIVLDILGDDVGRLNQLAAEALDFFGLAEDAVKN